MALRAVPSRLANPTAPGYESATERRIAGPVGAAIAQLVEHLIRNEGVGGSNPSCGTTYLPQIQRRQPSVWQRQGPTGGLRWQAPGTRS